MADEILTGLLPHPGLRVLLATTSNMAFRGRQIHQCRPGAAAVLAQGLTAASLMAMLGKEAPRLNFQLECDGPLRGLFVDASSRGRVRAYVKNPLVEFQGRPGEFEWRAILGNSGFLSVLRERANGELYRSSVQLQAFDLALDVEHYFEQSDQTATRVLLSCLPVGDEPLGVVAGLLLQALPGTPHSALDAEADRLRQPEGGWVSTLLRLPHEPPSSWVPELFPGQTFQTGDRVPWIYECRCSRERVLSALAAIGKTELEDLLATQGHAEMTCEFCMTRYDISGAEIRELLGGGTRA